MMIDRLRDILAGIRGVGAWKISDRRIEGRELYFVRRDVDMQRSKEVRHTFLTVYRDFREGGSEFRGSVTVQIHPTATDGEIRHIVERSLDSARWVRNQRYPLVEPGAAPEPMPRSSFAGKPLEAWLGPLAQTIFAQEQHAEARINSAELFLSRAENRILNSTGLDVGYESYAGYLELVVEDDVDKKGKSEVELYREVDFSEFDTDFLAAEVRRQLASCADRRNAGPAPHLKRYPVLLSGDPVPEFFGYYLIRSAAESVYAGISTAKVGQCIQGDTIEGDTLSLTLDPFLRGSTASAPVDGDGFPLRSTPIVNNGTLERYWGPLRFCHYLEVPPTGTPGNVIIQPGSRSLGELRGGPQLEVVYFSDFITEPLTGDFGGEIRLAYYTDGEGNRSIVTGGSVSGNVRDVQSRMLFSKETQSC
jgi:PmbA protein